MSASEEMINAFFFVWMQLDMTDFYDDDYDDLDDEDSEDELEGGDGDADDSGNGESWGHAPSPPLSPLSPLSSRDTTHTLLEPRARTTTFNARHLWSERYSLPVAILTITIY